jgi:AcrR family transcriptional regulator/DNA-binding XRE family transcriptional regulator
MALGLSLREVAHAIEVSAATLSAIETGKTAVSAARLNSIASVLGTTERILRGPSPQMGPAGPEASPDAKAKAGGWRLFAPLEVDVMLNAAITAFVKTGYHGATIRSIAALAGISVPGLYHHYVSKQDLLVQILDLTMSELQWRVPAARDEGRDSVERLSLIVECLALFHMHRRDLAFLGASEMRSVEPENRRRIAARRTHIQQIMDAEIAAGLAKGQFRTRVPKDAGRAISTMCTSLPQWFRADGSLPPEKIAKEYANFALAMVISA